MIYLKKINTTNYLTFCLVFMEELVVYYQIYYLPKETLEISFLLKYDKPERILYKFFLTAPTKKAANLKCTKN